jgi:hypothetical protein
MTARRIWALRSADGLWRAPDHFVSSRTPDPRSARPFFDERGRRDADLFQKLDVGSEVVPHPHPELWR